jgi:hypothetical protein
MGQGLGAVNQHLDAVGMGEFDDPRDRIDRAQRVGDVHDADELDSRREHFLEGVHPELPAIVDRRHDELGAGLLADELPGHDVRVVLHMGDQDLIAGLEQWAGP